ncbi:MAG: DNA gyrase inhibitor YacG [Comamonadaceae bacterium]|nr:DNA gyrase inhibitor YacG [Rhodoferax sp.]TSA07558.1 MAG: DNA gyrase inhibitor YacG [Comamonadaceae bacterium]
MTSAPKTVSCPSCGGDSVYAISNPFRPFCSARCKNVDLGAWASESFRMPISSNAEDQPLEDAPPSSASH